MKIDPKQGPDEETVAGTEEETTAAPAEGEALPKGDEEAAGE